MASRGGRGHSLVVGQWTELLGELSDAHLDEIFTACAEQQVGVGDVLLHEGSRPDAMYFLIRGLVEVRLESLPGAPIARLGPGEIVGDMSFLDHLPAAASVVVAEPSVVLRCPHAALLAHFEAHPDFAAAFYRVLASTLSARLRRALAQLGSPATLAQGSASHQRATAVIGRFTAALLDADKQALRKKRPTEAATLEVLTAAWDEFMRAMTVVLAEAPGEAAVVELGRLAQRELLPYLLMTQVAERMYSKPRGYAGDYLTLELMYASAAGGTGRIGPLLDQCFLRDRAARAVRNRRVLLADELVATVARAPAGHTTQVLVLASGPAREVLDAFARLPDPSRLHATLVDADGDALEFVAREAASRGLTAHLTLAHENPIFLAIGRRKLALPPLDLVYSIGLIDYTQDKVVLRIIDHAHDVLAPGGRVILGNFHPANTSRVFMDHVLEWQLIHRTEADLDRMYLASKFGRPSTRVVFEAEGIDLFAECAKVGGAVSLL